MCLLAHDSLAAQNLGAEWVENSKGKHLRKSVNYEGRLVYIASKKEHHFSKNDRIARGILAVLALIFSLGLAYLSKSIKNLLHKSKESVYLTHQKISKFDACTLIAPGKLKEFEQWLNNGSINTTEELWSGELPLHWAVKCGQLEMVELLLGYSKKVNGNVAEINATSNSHGRDCAGRTPLSMIVDTLEVEEETRNNIIKLLLDNGADANIPDANGYLPLHHAVKFAFRRNGTTIDSIKTLIEHTDDINAVTHSDGISALGIAVYFQLKSLINILLESGANINAPLMTKDGFSLLHLAVCGYEERGNIEIVKLVLNSCDDIATQINATTKNGSTPLHYAAATGNLEMTKLLIAKGAHVNVKNNFDVRPVDLARVVKDKLTNPGEGRALFAAAWNAHLGPKLEEIISILESKEKIVALKVGPQVQLLLALCQSRVKA